MKKVILVIAGLMAVCILVVGIFSAGLVVGGLLLPDGSRDVSEALNPIVPQIVDIAPSDNDGPTVSDEVSSSQSPSATPPPAPSPELDELFIPFWEAWEIVNEKFVDQPVDQEVMMRGAIQGMLDSLGDQHTSYMDPETHEKATTVLDGTESYEGIGAWVDISSDYLTIISPFPGSPAEEAGLQPGDQIFAVDGEDMTGIDGELVRQKVIGPAGSTVTLTILRKGYEPFDIDVTRANVFVISTESYMMEDNIGYIRIINFGNKTGDDLREAIKTLSLENPSGLIVDLRYNGGGLLFSSVEVASEFIEEGEIVLHEVYGDGQRDTFDALKGGLALDIPLVVLVNEGSASASEIVAGALQDHGRAPLVGMTTFGKGSVQSWATLSDDQGAVRVTIARWLTPLERQIHEVGLEPDYLVPVVAQAAIDEGFDIETMGVDPASVVILTDEEVAEGRDPQLEKAVEVLKGLFK
jgi:carboxyl-terminal processing protease